MKNDVDFHSDSTSLRMERTMSMLKMDNEKSEHLLDDYHAYHFPRATYTEVGGLLQPAALPQSTEKLATEFSTQNHKTNQPTEEVCTYNLITVWSCLFHCPSYLFALVFLNTSSSLLMSATFIFLNYSRNLQTWSFPMAWVTRDQSSHNQNVLTNTDHQSHPQSSRPSFQPTQRLDEFRQFHNSNVGIYSNDILVDITRAKICQHVFHHAEFSHCEYDWIRPGRVGTLYPSIAY